MTAAAATITAALHVSDRIKDYGSYAGFACVLGLAVLSLLYFAQAREVKRLREWAGRAPERDADLQARVTAEAQQRAAVPAVPAAAPKPATAAATPAGQTATPKPATAPAQQPAGQPAQQPAAAPKPGVPAPATAAAAAAGAAAAASASPAGTTTKPEEKKPDAQPDGDGTTPPPSTPKPATPVGASPNGAVDQPTQITPAPAAAAAAAAAATPKPGQPLSPPPTATAVADDDHEPSPLRTTLMIVGGVLGVIVVVLALVLVVFNGSDNKPSPNTIGGVPASTGTSSSSSNGKSNGTKPAPISRGDVNVAVLNGTTIPGLARQVGTKIQTAGFKLGTVTNAPDQLHSATLVAYQPGHVNEARVVAKLIHVGSDALKPVDQSTAVVAGQDAFVVVTVGADQSQ